MLHSLWRGGGQKEVSRLSPKDEHIWVKPGIQVKSHGAHLCKIIGGNDTMVLHNSAFLFFFCHTTNAALWPLILHQFRPIFAHVYTCNKFPNLSTGGFPGSKKLSGDFDRVLMTRVQHKLHNFG